MPELKIQSIISCSNEDQRNPAENLLKDGGSYKWKSAIAGEKSVSVVLQLNKASQIHAIDIGNEGSAFVEVLVRKDSDTTFDVLLVASAFMTPLESRNGTNRNGVRMFGPDKLNKITAEQKWNIFKIVCSQPFCKTSTYGLSFIKFHSPPEATDTERNVTKLGHFTIKENEESDVIQVGSLFANRSKIDSTLSSAPLGAAAIRAAARQSEHSTNASSDVSSSNNSKDDSRKRKATSPPKTMPVLNNAKGNYRDTDEEDLSTPLKKPTLKKQSSSLSSIGSYASSARPENSALKRTKTEPTVVASEKSFCKLLEGVTFVLSGFQNPYRAELRDKACDMGAKYRSDWDRGCTHLICAFANTPKYKQVSGKGKIVSKGWVLDSCKQKRVLPWRKYRLGEADSPSDDSDDNEIKRYKPVNSQLKKVKRPTKSNISYDDDSDSGGDTEDELNKAKELSEKKKVKDDETEERDIVKYKDPYGRSTDEDEPGPSTVDLRTEEEDNDSCLPDLPEFYTDKTFFFYGDFPAAEQRLLTRYISAYNGEVEDYMSKKVNYVITLQKWDDNFEEALSENPNLVFVKHNWILTCHQKSKLVPYQPYIIVPM